MASVLKYRDPSTGEWISVGGAVVSGSGEQIDAYTKAETDALIDGITAEDIGAQQLLNVGDYFGDIDIIGEGGLPINSVAWLSSSDGTTNMPFEGFGICVTQSVATWATEQTIYSYSGSKLHNVFHRMKANGSWSEWYQSLTTQSFAEFVTPEAIGAAPKELVSASYSCATDAEIDTLLETVHSGMSDKTCKVIDLYPSASGLGLSSTRWTVTFSRTSANYGFVIAKTYTNRKAITKTRCKYNGTWSTWRDEELFGGNFYGDIDDVTVLPLNQRVWISSSNGTTNMPFEGYGVLVNDCPYANTQVIVQTIYQYSGAKATKIFHRMWANSRWYSWYQSLTNETFSTHVTPEAIGAAKVEVGTYTGTGVCGSDNKNSLTFSFIPKCVFIRAENGDYYRIDAIYGVSSIHTGPPFTSGHRANISWEDTKITWYAVSSYIGDESVTPHTQLNTFGYVYHYIAIG